jgi:hypothetical protein
MGEFRDKDLEGQDTDDSEVLELPTQYNKVIQEAPKPTQQTLSTYQKIADQLNALAHLPVLEYLVNMWWWSMQLLSGPFYFLLLFPLMLYDLLSGYVIWKYDEPAANRPIIITGCDTGFGHELALRLVAKGWKVYASCLTDAGVENLVNKSRAGSGSTGVMVALRVDVTKSVDVEGLIKRVEQDHPQGIYALVNNAGAHVAGA